MKNSYGSGLVYQTDEGTLSIYDMYVKNQVVFHVVVDNADPTAVDELRPVQPTPEDRKSYV